MNNLKIIYQSNKKDSILNAIQSTNPYSTFLLKSKKKMAAITLNLFINLKDLKDMNAPAQSKKLQSKYRMRYNGGWITYNDFIIILETAGLIWRSKSYLYNSKTNPLKDGVKPFCKDIKIIDKDDEYFRANLKDELLKGKWSKLETINIDPKKIITEPTAFKTKEDWIKEYNNERPIIETIYKTYYDMDEVKEYLIELEGTIDHKGRILDQNKIISLINKAERYNQQIWTFSKTDEGRLYNPVSSQPSILRPLLKMEGEYLIELDIKNSQPLLLSLFINNDMYKEAVETGLFYDILSKDMNIERDKVKTLAMKWIFFSKKPLKSGRLYNIMEKHFKGAIDQINNIKSNNLLWRLLQMEEATIFVKGLLNNKDYITIHDSILIKQSTVDMFKEQVNNLYLERGLNPTIDIKNYNLK